MLQKMQTEERSAICPCCFQPVEGKQAWPPIKTETLDVDLERGRCVFKGKRIPLTRGEIRVVMVLARRPGLERSRLDITEAASVRQHEVSDRAADTHVRRIRKKFEIAGANPIKPVHGVGYRWVE